RQQHVVQLIRPALERGAMVLSDRYADATVAYQGFGQGVDQDTVRDLNLLATGGVLPDLTLLLDLAPEIGMAPIRRRPRDAFQRMGLEFHRRVRDGYLEIARGDKARVVVLDADRDVDLLHAAVLATVDEWLERRGGRRVRWPRRRPPRGARRPRPA